MAPIVMVEGIRLYAMKKGRGGGGIETPIWGANPTAAQPNLKTHLRHTLKICVPFKLSLIYAEKNTKP